MAFTAEDQAVHDKDLPRLFQEGLIDAFIIQCPATKQEIRSVEYLVQKKRPHLVHRIWDGRRALCGAMLSPSKYGIRRNVEALPVCKKCSNRYKILETRKGT
jgi:hypothetical protein